MNSLVIVMPSNFTKQSSMVIFQERHKKNGFFEEFRKWREFHFSVHYNFPDFVLPLNLIVVIYLDKIILMTRKKTHQYQFNLMIKLRIKEVSLI